MNRSIRFVSTAAAALALGGCVIVPNDSGSQRSVGRQASSAAESACMVAVNRNYGGNVRSVEVVSSEFSEANSLVMVNAVGVRGTSAIERWRCLVSNDGQVEDLSVAR